MLVRALEACFIAGQRRRAGAEFDYPLREGEKLPPHLTPVKQAPPAKKEEPLHSPVALSEMASVDGKGKSFVDAVSKKSKPGPDQK